MHAVLNRSSLWGLVAIAVLSTLGCRGSRPFNSMVNVTRDDTVAGPEIDAPQQRLALAKRRTSSTETALDPQSQGTVVQTSATEQRYAPRDNDEAQFAAKRSLTTLSQPSSSSDPASEATVDSASTAAAGSDQGLSANPLTLPSSEEIANVSLPTGDAEELMVAFKDYPPEVQREALRRLVAATAQSAERSDQPKSVTKELEERLSNSTLPELPESSPLEQNGHTAQRIGTQPPTSALVADTTVSSGSGAEPDRQAESTEPIGENRVAEGTPVAMTTPNAPAETVDVAKQNAAVKVQPAVVSTPADENSVAQASVEKDLEPPVGQVPEANQVQEPREFLESFNSGELFGQLVRKLSVAPADESEADRASRLIKLRHLMVLSGDPDGAVEQIEGMNESEQEYLRHQLLGLWTMIDPQGHPVPSRRFSSAIPQIRQAAKFAAAATDSLEVRSLAFCTEIESYGQIKPFKSNRFAPGQQVILYCEIENFTAAETEDGFETHLQGSYDLFNEDDEKVVSQLLPADQQVSANYLRDYFIAYQMYLPEQLRPGQYRLQLTMEDVHGKKYGQASIAVEIKK